MVRDAMSCKLLLAQERVAEMEEECSALRARLALFDPSSSTAFDPSSSTGNGVEGFEIRRPGHQQEQPQHPPASQGTVSLF